MASSGLPFPWFQDNQLPFYLAFASVPNKNSLQPKDWGIPGGGRGSLSWGVALRNKTTIAIEHCQGSHAHHLLPQVR